MKTTERVLNFIASRLDLGLPVVDREVLGQKVRARLGVVAERPDYDDAWTYSLITESSVFFDVGCNVGECSLWAFIDDPRRRTVAIDANPKALAVAAETLFLNGAAEGAIFKLAFVSDTDGNALEFFTVGTGAAGSRYASHAVTAARKHSSIQVRTKTLDSIAEDTALWPDLIKLDIEGAEAEALNGATGIVHERQPRILVEMHSQAELPMEENGKRVLAWCREMGYEAYYLKQHELVTSPGPFVSRGRCHLLLLPQNQKFPAYLNEINQGATLEAARKALAHHSGLLRREIVS